MHSADVRATLDDVIDVVYNSGYVVGEHDTNAKALVMYFVVADLPLVRAEGRSTADDLRAEILTNHLLRETARFGTSRERRMAFLRAVQAAVRGCFRGERNAITRLRTEVEGLATTGGATASLPLTDHSFAFLPGVDEEYEGDL